MSDHSAEMVASVLILVVFFSGLALGDCNSRHGHEQLGSKGHSCFANKTCREGLRCLSADGLDPTCVKP